MNTAQCLQALGEQLNKIEALTLLASKTILTIDEAVLFTGFTKGFLYKKTSEKAIPHFKKNRKLLFRKSELEEWLTTNRVMTEAELQSKASTYIATHK